MPVTTAAAEASAKPQVLALAAKSPEDGGEGEEALEEAEEEEVEEEGDGGDSNSKTRRSSLVWLKSGQGGSRALIATQSEEASLTYSKYHTVSYSTVRTSQRAIATQTFKSLGMALQHPHIGSDMVFAIVLVTKLHKVG